MTAGTNPLVATIRIVESKPLQTARTAPSMDLKAALDRLQQIDSRCTDTEFAKQLAVAYPSHGFTLTLNVVAPLVAGSPLDLTALGEAFRWEAKVSLRGVEADEVIVDIQQVMHRSTGGRKTSDSRFRCKVNETYLINGRPPGFGGSENAPSSLIVFGVSETPREKE